jgi:hypothetical protein
MSSLRVLAARNARAISLVPWTRGLNTPAETFPANTQTWSHPSSNAQFSDNDIKRLADSPRQPLTLADLVKYATHLDRQLAVLTRTQAWQTSAFTGSATIFGELYPLAPPRPSSTPNTKSPQLALHCCLESAHLEDLQQLSTLSFCAATMGSEAYRNHGGRGAIYRCDG